MIDFDNLLDELAGALDCVINEAESEDDFDVNESISAHAATVAVNTGSNRSAVAAVLIDAYNRDCESIPAPGAYTSLELIEAVLRSQ